MISYFLFIIVKRGEMDEFQGYGFVVCGKENAMGKSRVLFERILLAIIVLEIKIIPDFGFLKW